MQQLMFSALPLICAGNCCMNTNTSTYKSQVQTKQQYDYYTPHEIFAACAENPLIYLYTATGSL